MISREGSLRSQTESINSHSTPTKTKESEGDIDDAFSKYASGPTDDYDDEPSSPDSDGGKWRHLYVSIQTILLVYAKIS